MKKQIKFPSIKTISKKLAIDIEAAKTVRGLIDGSFTTKAIDKLIKETNTHPSFLTYSILDAICRIIGGFNVDYIDHNKDNYRNLFGIEYINQGDVYINTLMFDYKKERFFISSVGDIIEKRKL